MKKYHKDYEPKTNRYLGEYYIFPIKTEDKKKIFIKNVIFCVLYFLLFILAGLVNNDGSRSFFIAVPYAFLFLPAVYLAMGTFSLLHICEKMEKVVYDKSIGRIYRSYIGILAISAYLCLADAIYLPVEWEHISVVREIVFLCIFIFTFFSAFLIIRDLQKMQKKVMIIKRDNEVPVGK